MRAAHLCSIVVAVVMLSCGSEDPAGEAPEELTGVIISIDSPAFGEVEGFELKVDEVTYEIVIDPQRDYSLPLAHLSEHLRLAEPVRVELEEIDGELVALSIDDA